MTGWLALEEWIQFGPVRWLTRGNVQFPAARCGKGGLTRRRRMRMARAGGANIHREFDSGLSGNRGLSGDLIKERREVIPREDSGFFEVLMKRLLRLLNQGRTRNTRWLAWRTESQDSAVMRVMPVSAASEVILRSWPMRPAQSWTKCWRVARS